MKTLVLGGGGREHALAWRIGKDAGASKVFLHPGNAGTWAAGIESLGDVPLSNREALATAAERLDIDLVVIGPEVLLAQGYADYFRKEGFLVVGPGEDGAQLETSKAFAKEFLLEGGIPTARYRSARTPQQVREYADRYPIVLKLDGLAAGKGVVVAQSSHDTEEFISRVWEKKEFGDGAPVIVVEDFLPGRELSYIGLCDGKTFLALSTASDYKRIGDKDQGPNTGGMGAISPSPLASPALEAKIQSQIVEPTLRQLARQGIDYRGALYFGLMISDDGNPSVLEFNARFGDPETQALLLRVEGNFTELLTATAEGRLGEISPPTWSKSTSVYVVASAHGYPGTPRTGDAIEGVDALPSDATLFYSGVGGGSRGLVTQGGRVLGIGVLGSGAEDCRRRVYGALERVRWDGMYYRRDIGL